MPKNTKTPKKIKKNKEINEQELLDTIDLIARKLAYKFRFGYHEIEDMRQQISVFAIEGLANYDYKRPLENFLWTHVRNRLFNFKRDNYQRPDSPCSSCPFFNKQTADTTNNCNKFSDKQDCELYQSWYGRNNAKKNLMYLNTLEEFKEQLPGKHNANNAHENTELVNFLEENLQGEYRKIYLKIKHGNKVYKNETEKLFNKIKELTDE